MKNLKLYVFLICSFLNYYVMCGIGSSQIISTYYVAFNAGKIFNNVNEINGNWISGGNLLINYSSVSNYNFGFGIYHEVFKEKINYGFDVNYSKNISKIENGTLLGLKEVNLTNDTFKVENKFTSINILHSLILSPNISYSFIIKNGTMFSFAFSPQIIYNFSSESDNTLFVNDTNSFKVIGLPNQNIDKNGSFVSQYITKSIYKDLQFNAKFSIELEWFVSYSQNGRSKIGIKFDYITGQSQVNTSNLVSYPSVSLKYYLPLQSSKIIYQGCED